MNPAKLNRRVAIDSEAITEDSFGGEVKTFGEVGTRAAGIYYGTGRERREAAQESAVQTATIETRLDSLTRIIKPRTHQFRFDGASWDIVSAVFEPRQGEAKFEAMRRG